MSLAGDPALRDSVVSFENSQGLEAHGTLLHMSPHLAVFELYSPADALQSSEVLNPFKILVNETPVYAGRAVLAKIINTGSVWVCEAQLEEPWQDATFLSSVRNEDLLKAFGTFLSGWQKVYVIRPEFKVAVADLQAFLSDLRTWVEQLELGIRSSPSGDRAQLEHDIAAGLSGSISDALNVLFDKFQATAAGLEERELAAHRNFARKQLHPLLFCSPFLYRTFFKPLGFAGDYEIVNMIIRDPQEGGSLFSKLVNIWFLSQPPAEAHRNRIAYLMKRITEAALQASAPGAKARVLSLGCGPAHEVQQFIAEKDYAGRVEFTLIDFNQEALNYVQSRVEELNNRHHRDTRVNIVRRSVNQLFKEASKSISRPAEQQYDLVYCAGLYDYLTNPICARLSNLLFDWLAPGGTLVTTNVDPSNSRRITMDLIMEWHLIYRTGKELAALKPERAQPADCSVRSDPTGLNLYFEALKRT